jgi:hypothetical protein
MAKTSNDRRRMTESEGAALVQEWRRSGLSIAEFGRSRGVGAHRLRYWERRLAPGPAETPFVVMSAEGLGSSAEPSGDDAIEIVVGEFFVRVPAGVGTLAEVLRTLKDADR